MQERDLMPDKFTFVTILSACTSQAALVEGRMIHNRIAGSALESDAAVGNALVNMYGKSGSIEDARKIFDNIPEQDLLSWTAIISAYAMHECSQDALQLLDWMQWEGLLPDKVTFVSILSVFASPTALAEGKRMHARIVGAGFASDSIVGNAILNMYVKCGSVEEARQMFDKMTWREVASWTAMIAAYSQHGQEKNALELVAQMQLEGVGLDKVVFLSILSACASQASLVEGKWMHLCIISGGLESDIEVGNALISMYGKCGCLEDALVTLKKMCNWDDITFVVILSAFANQASLAEGKWIHACIVCQGCEQDHVVGNALLNMYGRCGSLVDARLIFDKSPEQNVALWNAMIGSYAQNGLGELALDVFDQMQQKGVTPDDITFVGVLSACSHAGLVDEGSQHFLSMHHNYGIVPEVDHYNCMIDLLGRVGKLDEAEDMIYKMPLQPTVVSWMTLLGSCKNQADVDRGERAAVRAYELDPGNTAPYVTLSNIYAALGREDDAAKVMQRLKDLDLKKQTVCDSMISFNVWTGSLQIDNLDPHSESAL